MKTRPPLEKTIQANGVKNLRAIGCHVSNFSQARASKQTCGIPDSFVMLPRYGVSLWVEWKRPGGKLSAGQQAWHRTAKEAGVPCIVATCTSDVLDALKKLGVPIS